MKTNPNHPIAQCRHQDGSFMTKSSFERDGNANEFYVLGLSKREHFASMALQGFMSTMDQKAISLHNVEELPINAASWSVAFADALIKALNKEEQ